MQRSIPSELKTTYNMLRLAFPSGLSEKEYYSVLNYLYDNMSDRNLALVMSLFLDREDDVATLNDIYKVVRLDDALKTDQVTYDKLINNGYKQWLEED